MSTVARARLVRVNQLVLDQADFFEVDGFTRQVGLTLIDVTSVLFFNNSPQPWTLTNGAVVTDSQVRSGFIYFNEITGAPGYYSVRLRPNAAGYWRLASAYAAGEQNVVQDYDVIVDPPQISGGLSASFTNC